MSQDLSSRIRDASANNKTAAKCNLISPFPIMSIPIYNLYHYLAIKHRKEYYHWLFHHVQHLSSSKLDMKKINFDILTLKQFRTMTKIHHNASNDDFTMEYYYLYILPFITEPQKDEN